ncbi:MAG: DHHA1 domain-containing protein, partial [Fimbriimonadales bacterium]|nr:DHHA1 domain-containing protein [Fimbriimonadales bacterium]
VSEMTPVEVEGIPVVAHVVAGADGKSLGMLADQLIQRGVGVVALGATQNGKAVLVVKVAPQWVQRGLHAGNLVRTLAQQIGGSGGGKPDFAQAGGNQPEKLPDALKSLPQLIRQSITP